MGLFSEAEDKTKELFSFNLIPPKTKEEMEHEAKQAERNFYSIMLPGFIFLLTLILFFFNQFVLQRSIQNWERTTDNLASELNNPNNYLGGLKTRNGELKVKTDFIAEPVQKNVDFDNIFSLTESVFQGNSSGSQITSYGREDDGDFIVNAVSKTVDGPAEIEAKFRGQEGIGDVNLRLVQRPAEANEYRFSISFQIISINDNSSGVNNGQPVN